jgi:hypothetical protein
MAYPEIRRDESLLENFLFAVSFRSLVTFAATSSKGRRNVAKRERTNVLPISFATVSAFTSAECLFYSSKIGEVPIARDVKQGAQSW